MIFENKSKMVFIGDSITDFERARPLGEGLFGGIGKSYVAILEGLIAASYPERHLRIINMGTSGNTTRDLLARWQTDVFDLQPDYLGILIGINDVWRQFDTPEITEGHVLPEEYRQNLEKMIADTLPTVKGVLVIGPYMMETNEQDPMLIRMKEYARIAEDLAEKYGCIFVDLQSAFNRYFAQYHPMAMSWDRIHPNTVGHCIIAKEILNASGFQW